MADYFRTQRAVQTKLRGSTKAKGTLTVGSVLNNVAWGTPVIVTPAGERNGIPKGSTGIALGAVSGAPTKVWVVRKDHHTATAWLLTYWKVA